MDYVAHESNGYELKNIQPFAVNPLAYAPPEPVGDARLDIMTPLDPPKKPKRKKVLMEDDLEEEYDDGPGEPEPEPVAKKWPSVLADGWKPYLLRTLNDVFLSSKMNWLLLCVPASIIMRVSGAPDVLLFITALAALCPLAERIAFVTDEMAKYTSDTLGGLMSATMGNITELIVSVVALAEGKLILVQMSLIGSILSNLLLVLGCAFLVGGIKHRNQRYSRPAAVANAGLLLLSVSALLFPMTMTVTHSQTDAEKKQYPVPSDPNVDLELSLSQFCSFILLLTYGFLIIYQLKTHKQLFENQDDDDDEEEEPPVLGLYGAIIWAAIISAVIALLSEFIVSTIEGAAESAGIPLMFISTILLPIVGNAAEHASAIIFAYRNKMDIALGIAVGSATQIALFVVPFCVFIGLCIGQPLTLDFGVFPTVTLYLTIVMTISAISSGTSDWLKGAMLLVSYILLSASYWVVDTPAELEHP